MIRILIFCLSLLCCHHLVARKPEPEHIQIQPVFGTENLKLNTYYLLNNHTDSILIETLRFYISGIEFFSRGECVYKEKNSFHLVDLAKPQSLNISLAGLAGLEYDQLTFNLGIDSTTNVSGAMGGELDPSTGMYWTWQSGYINFKLEGHYHSGATKMQQFVYHLGGYAYPFAGIQQVKLPCKPNQNHILILALDYLLQADFSAIHPNIMSPGAEAVQMAKMVAAQFSLKE
ncbi:MAG: hypothetical protein HYZ14_10805 [Bacteroidetes bacterium]|nr:hypothetical protein [Bacteroidota bacterium]